MVTLIVRPRYLDPMMFTGYILVLPFCMLQIVQTKFPMQKTNTKNKSTAQLDFEQTFRLLMNFKIKWGGKNTVWHGRQHQKHTLQIKKNKIKIIDSLLKPFEKYTHQFSTKPLLFLFFELAHHLVLACVVDFRTIDGGVVVIVVIFVFWVGVVLAPPGVFIIVWIL